MKDYSAQEEFEKVSKMLDKLQDCPLHRDDEDLVKLCKQAGDIYRDFFIGTQALKKKADAVKSRLDEQEKEYYEANKDRYQVLSELQETAKSLKQAHDEFVTTFKKSL